MDDIAFSDWPGQPVDLSSSNPWLPAYGFQAPTALLDKDDFIGNPDAALFLHGSTGPHYVFLETIMEETSDDLRSESDRSGSRASPAGWLATDSESGSVIHVDLDGIDDIDSGSESEIVCPAKRRRQDPNLLSIPVMIYSDTDSNNSLSRSSSLLQFETLEKHCQDVYSSSPSILSLFSQDSLEQQRKSNDLSPDSLERCHSDSESESDYYKTLKIDVPKTKRYRDSLFYNTKRLSDSSDKSDSDSQDSDETLQVASRSNSCKSVQNLKSCRSFDSLNVKNGIKKEKMSAENLSEDSGYSDHLCNYMKNKSSSIPNMQVQGISVPEKSTTKVSNELKRANGRCSNEDIDSFRLKNIKVSDGFDAYDGEPVFQNFASHFGSSYQDLTMFEKCEPYPSLIDRFTSSKRTVRRGGSINGGSLPFQQHQNQADVVLNLGKPVECVAASKINNAASSSSEPNLLRPANNSDAVDTLVNRRFSLDKSQVLNCIQNNHTYLEASVCVSSVPKDLNLAGGGSSGDLKQYEDNWSFANTSQSIAVKNWDLADLPPTLEPNLNFTDNFLDDEIKMEVEKTVEKKPIYSTNITVVLKQRESSSSESDISNPRRYHREGSYVKAIADYLDITEIDDDEREQSYDTADTSEILDIDSRIEKSISETSINQLNNNDKLEMFFHHSTPIVNNRNVLSTPNLSAICDQLFETSVQNVELRRSMQNMPRKSSLADRSLGTSEEKTLTTSKNFSGSGSTAKGVHFCPIVSEVSWKDSSSDLSSYSVSSTGHDSTPEPSPPRRRDVKTPPRKSSSQPELPKSGETDKETEYIFIPLNPHKWASSTPSVSTANGTTRNTTNSSVPNGTVLKGALTTAAVKKPCGDDVYIPVKAPPTDHHVNKQPSPVVQPRVQQPSVAVMEATVVHRPVSAPPPKPTRSAKLGGFLSRFTSFRFSTRKSSNEDKSKKKQLNVDKKKSDAAVVTTTTTQQPVATDYIYIPLKGPLPAGLDGAKGNHNKNGGDRMSVTTKVLVDGREVLDECDFVSNGIRRTKSQSQSTEKCISAKPPLPKLPPRIVSACVKKQGAQHTTPPPAAAPLHHQRRRIDSGDGTVTAAAAVVSQPRNASSMEPMGLIETDLDTEVTVITGAGAAAGVHVKTRSLMNLGGAEPPPQRGSTTLLSLTGPDTGNRPHKSMEFLLDKQNLKAVEPPENELQKGTGERVMSEHQLRVQRSLQKLTVPEWYKANQVPREGFILKKQQRNEPRWTGTGTANNSKTPSLSSLGSGLSPILLSPTPHAQQPFTRWSTSKLNSAASSPCASTRSSFNHRTSNGGISPCSVRSSFSYRQPYLGWRSQERLSRPRTPAERLATSLLPPNNPVVDNTENPEIQTSIKEVTSAIVHYVSGLKPDQNDRNSLSPTSSPRFGRESISPRFKSYENQDTSSQRSASPQSRGSQKLCWLESSFVGTRPLDSPQTPVSLTSDSASQQQQPLAPPTSLRLDLQKNINNEMISHIIESTNRPSPSSTTLEDVLDSLLGLPPSTRAPSPSLQETASASTSPSKLAQRGGEQYRRRSEGSEPSTRPVTAVSSEQPRRVSFHASPSSDNQQNSASASVKCRYSRCGKVSAKHSDTGKKYKSCHNCIYIYCSRECRRAHWEKHRMTCLFSRVGTLCRQVLAAAKEDKETLKNLSLLARQGFLGQGNGAVKCFFSSPECAEKFIQGNAKAFGEPVYVPWTDLLPSEMGPNLYSDLIKMCKTYNPDTRFVLYVSVCVVSEVPATGAVKWERQLVSRCAKIRLCKSVLSQSTTQPEEPPAKPHFVNDVFIQKSREISFIHIQRQLRQRGISLKRQFPEVYQKLRTYVECRSDKFAPVTIYPKDIHTGKNFMCIIMPDVAEPDKLKLKLPTDSPRSNKTSDVD